MIRDRKGGLNKQKPTLMQPLIEMVTSLVAMVKGIPNDCYAKSNEFCTSRLLIGRETELSRALDLKTEFS